MSAIELGQRNLRWQGMKRRPGQAPKYETRFEDIQEEKVPGFRQLPRMLPFQTSTVNTSGREMSRGQFSPYLIPCLRPT
jgi:hypothetical protein